jgi:hypothetical protein
LTSVEYAVLFIAILIAALVVWQRLGRSLDQGLSAGTEKFNGALSAAIQRGAEREPADYAQRPSQQRMAPAAPSAIASGLQASAALSNPRLSQPSVAMHEAAPGRAPPPGQTPDKGDRTPGLLDHRLGTGGKVAVVTAGAAAGAALAAGTAWGTAYGASLLCGPAAPACAGAVTVGLAGVGIYHLANGGYSSLKSSFSNVFASDTASVGDALAVGTTLGSVACGLGSGAAASGALGRAAGASETAAASSEASATAAQAASQAAAAAERSAAADPAAASAARAAGLESNGPKLLSPGRPAELIANKLEPHEAKFASEILQHRGGKLIGAEQRSMPGIDGRLDGKAISLKETEGGLSAVLKHASKAEAQAGNAGYHEVEVFIRAPNVGKDQLLDFGRKGPLSQIPNQGTIEAINVLTKDGWVRFIGAH